MDIHEAIRKHASPKKALVLQRFFKTGPGEYGEGDVFLGLTVPQSRRIASQFHDLAFPALKKLLQSPIHEERLIALLILVNRYPAHPQEVVDFYLENRSCVNNWDLVDSSAYQILGQYVLDKKTDSLDELARSSSLWDRRIAIVSTLAFIRAGRFDETLRISTILQGDRHDLIHKAVGWMLREVGKKDVHVLETYLQTHGKHMPRTTLRYAIERFPPAKRAQYLSL